jgi:hypothetical protein
MTRFPDSRFIDTKGFEPTPSHVPSMLLMTPTSIIGFLVGASLLSLAACNDYNGPYAYRPPNHPSFPNGTIQQPTTINLYPSQDSNRLYVFVTAVGSQSVSMSLAFDTGSAGITLEAQAIFPPSMVTASGFIFPEGQDTISYNGITVTKAAGSRLYGAAIGGTTENGNIGFAQVTVGDASGSLTTDVMPVFLYYSITVTGSPGTAAGVTHKQGWFGVNTEANKIFVTVPTAGASANLPCTLDTGADCYVISILKYLHYAPFIDAGFALTPAPLQACDITKPGDCTPVPMLTVGLTGQIESTYSQVTLTCPQPNYLGPETINGYFVCEDQIPFVTVAVTPPGQPTIRLTENVLFDSGNQVANIAQSSGTLPSTLLPNTTVSVLTPSGFDYTYTVANSGPTVTAVATSGSAAFGINFFTEHSFFIDFVTNTEGWM